MKKLDKPQILKQFIDKKELELFVQKSNLSEVIDISKAQIKELYKIFNPASLSPIPAQNIEEFCKKQPKLSKRYAVYFPWLKKVVVMLGQDAITLLRTNRNQHLINASEQTKLLNFNVGVAGMSVGGEIATSLFYSGISKTIKIADNDELDTSNLNRLKQSVADIGEGKTNLVARAIYELDPFAEVDIYEDGINKSNIDNFFSSPKIRLVIDEIDDFKMKYLLRVKAKENQIPLLMFTNLGDGILVDVERYDIQKNTQPFNGLLGDDLDEHFTYTEPTPEVIKKMSVKLVGQEYIPTSALKSLEDIGKSLVGRPQLYGSVAVSSGVASYITRKIALGENVNSGRYFLKLDDIFNISNDNYEATEDRLSILNKLQKNA